MPFSNSISLETRKNSKLRFMRSSGSVAWKKSVAPLSHGDVENLSPRFPVRGLEEEIQEMGPVLRLIHEKLKERGLKFDV